MKFMHLGDLHLGRSLGEFDLIPDQEYLLDQLLKMAKAQQVDAVLIAGDVYDRSIPSEAATKLLDSFLSRLAENQIKVFMISGNHDSDDRLNFGSSLFEASGIYISAVYNGSLYRQTVRDEAGELDVYLLPFVKASQVKRFYPDAEIETYEDAVRTILKNAGIDEARRNLLVAHQFVAGKSAGPELGGSEGLGTQNVGLVERIGYDCFDAFDYVALGHIHSPQSVGREEVRYSGSPLKYSLSEVHNEKSVPIVTIGEKGRVQIELQPIKPMRDLRHIKGPMKKLLDRENIEAPEDFIYVTLTDEEMINDVMGIFQATYPNTVKIDFDNSHTREIEQVDIAALTESKSFDELIDDFYQMIYGCEMTEDEKTILREVAKKAGVANEAD